MEIGDFLSPPITIGRERIVFIDFELKINLLFVT